MSTEIYSGGVTIKDPDGIEFFVVDWDRERLAEGVLIASSEWFIDGEDSPPALTKDQPSILTGTRRTQVRLSAGTTGERYTVTNRIVTNETPAQTKDASFIVVVEEE